MVTPDVAGAVSRVVGDHANRHLMVYTATMALPLQDFPEVVDLSPTFLPVT